MTVCVEGLLCVEAFSLGGLWVSGVQAERGILHLIGIRVNTGTMSAWT